MWLRAEKGCILRTLSRSKDLDGKESACNAGGVGLIPGSERSPGEENGNPLHYSCLENSMDRGAAGLQFIESQRVGHNWATNTYTYKSVFRWSLTPAVSSLLSILGTLNCNQWAQFLPGIQGLSDLQQWWALKKLVYMPSVGDLKTMSPLQLVSA